jgi:hypothetical protein
MNTTRECNNGHFEIISHRYYSQVCLSGMKKCKSPVMKSLKLPVHSRFSFLEQEMLHVLFTMFFFSFTNVGTGETTGTTE